MIRTPTLFLWVVYLVSQPFYVFRNGLPQPGDLLILVLAPAVLSRWNGKLTPTGKRTFKPLVWFTIWVCIVDYGWALILGQWGFYGVETFILWPTYYIYNSIIFLLALIMYQRYGDGFLRLTLYVVFMIVVFLVVAAFFYPLKTRGSLFFTNPNQLGYFALLSACIIVLLHRRLHFGAFKTAIGLSACSFLAVISAGRSALVGIAVLVAIIIISNPRVIILATIAALGLLLMGGPLEKAIDTTSRRALTHHNPHHSFFEQRGYDKITAHKEYLILGAGEGGNDRFKETTKLGAAEMHSSLGTIVFCYGLVGTILFALFVWRVLQGAAFRTAMLLTPPLLYTFAHQGLRFTLLWVLLGLFVAVKQLDVFKQAPRVATAPRGRASGNASHPSVIARVAGHTRSR